MQTVRFPGLPSTVNPSRGVQLKLTPSRDVGALMEKMAKCQGKHKKSTLRTDGRGYPAFKPGMSTARYVELYATGNGWSGARAFFAPLNSDPCTLYSGEDLHEIIDDAEIAQDAPQAAQTCADVPMVQPAPVAVLAVDPVPVLVDPEPVAKPARPDNITCQVLSERPTAVYCTPVYRIGVHEWCTVVYAHEQFAACTDHLWRRVDQNRGVFKPARDWPTYDSDRTHSGLPISLGKRVFDPNRADIKAALDATKAGTLPDWANDATRKAAADGIAASARFEASMARATVRAAPVAPADPAPVEKSTLPATVEKPIHMEAPAFGAALEAGEIALDSVGAENCYGKLADGREVYAKDVDAAIVARFDPLPPVEKPSEPAAPVGPLSLVGHELQSRWAGPKAAGLSAIAARIFVAQEVRANPAQRFRVVPFNGDTGAAPQGMRAFGAADQRPASRFTVERWRAVDPSPLPRGKAEPSQPPASVEKPRACDAPRWGLFDRHGMLIDWADGNRGYRAMRHRVGALEWNPDAPHSVFAVTPDQCANRPRTREALEEAARQTAKRSLVRPSVPIHTAHYRPAGPALRLAPIDPRLRIPARFAPLYLLAA